MNPPQRWNLLLALGLLAALTPLRPRAADPSTGFTYQGCLQDGGALAEGLFDLQFTVHDADQAGHPVGPAFTTNAVPVRNGLFAVRVDFGPIFDGSPRWLGVGVRTNGSGAGFTILSPRQPLTATPYALHAKQAATAITATTATTATTAASATSATTAATANAVAPGSVGTAGLAAGAVDSSRIADGTIGIADLSPTVASSTFWRLGGNAGTTSAAHYLGTADNQPLELRVNGQRVLRLEPTAAGEPNVVAGHSANTVASGIAGATIAGGAQNKANGDQASVGGGYGNRADGPSATVAGGYSNQAAAGYAVVGGGFFNTVSNDYATVAGGRNNTNRASSGAIGGGHLNLVAAPGATIPGGLENVASGRASLAAGEETTASGDQAVAIGLGNAAGGDYAVAFGYVNRADGRASVAVGENSTANGDDAVAMGLRTRASGPRSVGLGSRTTASGIAATALGHETEASGEYSTALGFYTRATGIYSAALNCSTVAGGFASQAAGTRAQAIHDGTFVWADHLFEDFASTRSNQFLIRARGGVGIGTNNPQATLHVAGSMRVTGGVRAGSENGTDEGPGYPSDSPGLVVRRVQSTSYGVGEVVALSLAAYTPALISLERDGTYGGFIIRYPANPGELTIAAMGIDATGTPRNFYRAVTDPALPGTVRLYLNEQNIVHFQCSFGVFSSQRHFTQVTLSRHGTDSHWAGTLTSTYSQ